MRYSQTDVSAFLCSDMNPHDYLNSFINFESHLQNVSSRNFNLERVHRLLCRLGDPQNDLKVIHVAGTKGKGSTCIFIASILRAAGYRVGLYTSPHMHRINERIRILIPAGKNTISDFEGSISDRQLKTLLVRIEPRLETYRRDPVLGDLTYFEVMTAVALCYFAVKKTDIVVLETGLGGRLDATNAVDALVNVITPVGLDHTHLLGNTLAKIAREKAAIIKHSFSKVVVAPQVPKAMAVITKRCKDLGIEPVIVGKDVIHYSRCRRFFHVRGRCHEYKDLKTSLVGDHQCQNAAAAIAVIELLPEFGFAVGPKAVRQGIQEARWPGRFEIISQKPVVIVDCAHNIDSAKALVRTFLRQFPGRKAVLILGISADKDINGICRALGAITKSVILTRARHPRANVFDRIRIQEIFKGKTVMDIPDVKHAFPLARKSAGRSGIVLAAGSVFLAAEVREEVKHVSI